MIPEEAKFDGEKGILFNHPDGTNWRFSLMRSSSKTPSQCPDKNFRENLLWMSLPDEPARLIWCNEDDEWFELSFTPIPKP